MPEMKIHKVFQPRLNFPPIFKNVGIYCRVSSRIPEQLRSLSAQASGLVQWVYKRPYMLICDIYIDIMSGEKADRPEFMRMINDAKEGRLNLILTKSVSRFGRNTEDTISAIRTLKAHNVQIIFDEEHIDTFNTESEFIISILSAYAQAENESRRQNQLWALEKRLKDGSSELYYRVCYGYQKTTDGIINISYDEAKTVQLIYSSYLAGESIIGIQKLLKEKGIPSPRGNESWCKRSIERILTDEKYTGDVIVRKTIASKEKGNKRILNLTEDKYMMSDVFPSIITKEIFEATQEERKKRTNIYNDDNGTHRKCTHYSSKKSTDAAESEL